MKWPSGSIQYLRCAALPCTPLCSVGFEAAEMAFAESSLQQTAGDAAKPKQARTQAGDLRGGEA